MGIGRIRPGKLGSYIKITCYEAAVGACRLSFASVRREYCGDGGPGLRDLALADIPSHHDMCLSSPRRTLTSIKAQRGVSRHPSGIPAIPRYGNGAPAGKTCFANPRFRPLTPTPFGLLRRHTPVLALCRTHKRLAPLRQVFCSAPSQGSVPRLTLTGKMPCGCRWCAFIAQTLKVAVGACLQAIRAQAR